MQLGIWAIRLTLIAALVTVAAYLFARPGVKWGRRLFALTALGVFSVEGILIYALLAGRYEIAYVWQFSEKAVSWYYKVAGAWAGQEGSFLLWAALTALLGLIIFRRLGKLERPFMITYSIILAALVGIVAFAPPFLYHEGANAQGILTDPSTGTQFVPQDGSGLVPSLENYWMVIHPPIMFSGFASLAILFCFAVAAMVVGDRKYWSAIARPWAAYSVAATGLGMCLGGFWAYETLGWGGFWAWDPVENVSLIPFLGAVAALHGLYTYNATGRMHRTNLFLAAFPFLAFLFGTFLTRSGTLAEVSVHSFDGLEQETKRLLIGLVEACIVGFVGLFTWNHFALAVTDKAKRPRFSRWYAGIVAVGVALLAWGLVVPGSFERYLKWPSLAWGLVMLVLLIRAMTLRLPSDGEELPRRPHEDASDTGRLQGLYVGIVVVMFIALLTLVGTAWPWISFLQAGKSTALEPGFYNRALLIPAIAMLILAALVPYLGWHKTAAPRFFNRLLIPWTGAVTLAVIGFYGIGIRSPIALIVATLCFLAVTANVWRILEVIKRSRVTVGGFIAHAGMAILILGMVISMGFERKEELLLNGAGPDTVMGYTVTRGPDRLLPQSTDRKIMRELSLKFEGGGNSFVAKPEYWERWNPGAEEPQRMTRPAIRRGLDNDVYVAIGAPQRPAGDVITLAPGESKMMNETKLERLNGLTANGPPNTVGTTFTTKFRATLGDMSAIIEPGFVQTENGFEELPADLGDGMQAVISNIRGVNGPVDFAVRFPEQLPITVFHKPMTILVWIGAGIMTAGALLSLRRRTLDAKALARKSAGAHLQRGKNNNAARPAPKKQNPPRSRHLRKSRVRG